MKFIFIFMAKIHFFDDELAYLQQSHYQLQGILTIKTDVKSVCLLVSSNNGQNRLEFLNL